MRAAHYTQYGGPEVFSVVEKIKPEPAKDQILVKVYCTTVNRTDTGMTSAMYFVSRFFTGLFKPRKNTPGTDFSGVVEQVGSEVTRFKIGDEVFGFDDNILGSQAEYLVIQSEGNVEHKADNVTHQQAAASIEGAHYALNVYRHAHVGKGQDVLIYGATGAIGTAAVQLAKPLQVDKLHAVANTKNLDLIKKLGAAKVYNYETEDFTESSHQYDLVFDAVGKTSYKACKNLLKKEGVYISTELGKNGVNIWLAMTNKQVKFPFPIGIKNSLKVVRELMQMDKFRPVIDRNYPLEDIQEAYEYVSSGKKTGNVVLEMIRE
ncbi:NAD(P)-dependent alcohol dehydrogenase [Portibacter marinus]|uniref:NAD(P)-dependent alcohol dehydrogenase n=1 Tax=Portibacter marinus TaxID=2898660 RepID=UPI001F30DBEC|nr:NAD(P)-dependent alcohol dehydrogenase [Portibacter marinus]